MTPGEIIALVGLLLTAETAIVTLLVRATAKLTRVETRLELIESALGIRFGLRLADRKSPEVLRVRH